MHLGKGFCPFNMCVLHYAQTAKMFLNILYVFLVLMYCYIVGFLYKWEYGILCIGLHLKYIYIVLLIVDSQLHDYLMWSFLGGLGWDYGIRALGVLDDVVVVRQQTA